MSQFKKLSFLALSIGIALTSACSSNKPQKEPIDANPAFYGVQLDKGYFSYYYDYDMGKSVASGSYDKPINGVNTGDFDHIEYKFSVDGDITYLDLVLNYKTKSVTGKPYFVRKVNDTEGKLLTINEKNRKVETCRTAGTFGESLGTNKPGCWITEKVQVVYPSFPNDPPVSIILKFDSHEDVGLDLNRKYIEQLQELSTKIKKKRVEITENERDDGLARLNLVEPTVAKPAPIVPPIVVAPVVSAPKQETVVKTYPAPVKPIKTGVVSKPVKKAPVKHVQKPAPKKAYKKPIPRVAADCPPEAVGSFKKTVIQKPLNSVNVNSNKKVDVYIDNTKNGENGVVIKQPVKIVLPESAK